MLSILIYWDTQWQIPDTDNDEIESPTRVSTREPKPARLPRKAQGRCASKKRSEFYFTEIIAFFKMHFSLDRNNIGCQNLESKEFYRPKAVYLKGCKENVLVWMDIK